MESHAQTPGKTRRPDYERLEHTQRFTIYFAALMIRTVEQWRAASMSKLGIRHPADDRPTYPSTSEEKAVGASISPNLETLLGKDGCKSPRSHHCWILVLSNACRPSLQARASASHPVLLVAPVQVPCHVPCHAFAVSVLLPEVLDPHETIDWHFRE